MVVGRSAAVALALAVAMVSLGAPAPSGNAGPLPRTASDLGTLEVNASASRGYPDCYTGAVTIQFWANVTGGAPPYSGVWSLPDGSHEVGLDISHHFSGWFNGRSATVNVTDAQGFTAMGAAPILLLYPPCPSVTHPGLTAFELGAAFVALLAVVGALVVVAALGVGRRRRRGPPTPPTP